MHIDYEAGASSTDPVDADVNTDFEMKMLKAGIPADADFEKQMRAEGMGEEDGMTSNVDK